MFYRILRPLLITLCLCFVLAACSDDEPTPEPTVAPTATTAAATATPAAQADSPLNAASVSPLAAPGDSLLTTPTTVTETTAAAAENVDVIPAAGLPVNPKTTATTGAATGRIFIHNDQGFRPVRNLIVALAEVIIGDDGVEKAAGYDAAAAPRADIRDDGTFVIEDVPPGRYGVILDHVMAQILIKEPENPENSLVITIEADKVTDLGDLVYGALDLPADSQ